MRFGVWRIDLGNTAVSSRTERGSCREAGVLIRHTMIGRLGQCHSDVPAPAGLLVPVLYGENCVKLARFVQTQELVEP
jgi:hypothetical protein